MPSRLLWKSTILSISIRQAVERAITPRTKAIAAVHMRGAPAQMDALLDLAKRKGLPLLEDVAQAGGGSFHGQRLGSLGTIGCFSFDYYKVIVSGEGGFVTTDDEWLYTRAQSWHDTAACWRPDRFAHERREGELFAGENYRMSELEGAVALAQIRKTDAMLAGYRRAKKLIKDGIDKSPHVQFRRLTDEQGDTAICLILFLPNADVTAERFLINQKFYGALSPLYVKSNSDSKTRQPTSSGPLRTRPKPPRLLRPPEMRKCALTARIFAGVLKRPNSLNS